jgi:uncharacterized lipoprotein YmbA
MKKVIMVFLSVVLAACGSSEEQKRVLITPAYYKIAEALCEREKGLLWIEVVWASKNELLVVCHSGAARTLVVK